MAAQLDGEKDFKQKQFAVAEYILFSCWLLNEKRPQPSQDRGRHFHAPSQGGADDWRQHKTRLAASRSLREGGANSHFLAGLCPLGNRRPGVGILGSDLQTLRSGPVSNEVVSCSVADPHPTHLKKTLRPRRPSSKRKLPSSSQALRWTRCARRSGS